MGVLDGLVVVDLSEVYQGPLAAQSLGDFGADVIKVERSGSGEVMRTSDPQSLAMKMMSSHFAAVNRNKRSIALDLKSADDLKILKLILDRADVLIHNYRPGVAERLGLDFETLRARNPRLIYAWATGFGETGPLSRLGGQDLIIQSLSGMARESVAANGKPHFTNPPAIDFASGMTLAQGILLALLHRERTGEGQKVSINLLDTAVAVQSLEASTQLMHGKTTHWFELAPNFVFETRDGWITVLGFFRENPLKSICSALGIADASAAPHLTNATAQREHRDEIHVLLADAFRALDTADIAARLIKEDLLCAPVQSLGEALAHPQLAANRTLTKVGIGNGTEATVVAHPLKLSGAPHSVRRNPPRLDEHRAEILRWVDAN
ncbi:MAG: CoA transferase [Hyphomicrobiaceae bacterium]|nr:MAG: CoA transferase [Hyphomicrobiaceae bacterium]